MKNYLLRRLLIAVPLIIVVTFITQALLVWSPGNYADEFRGQPGISQEFIEQQIKLYHLDNESVWARYWYWLGPALRGDLGFSFKFRAPVWDILAEYTPNTLLLTGSALIFSWALAIPLGAMAAFYRNRWVDRLCGFISFFGLSIPSVFFSLLMLVFAAKTGWFPTSGIHDQANWDNLTATQKVLDTLHHLVLPTIVLGTINLAQYMRQLRSEMIETLSEDYIRTARAKGLSERRVVFKHALSNALNPLITLFGFSLGFLLAGALLTETVFAWPGLGKLSYDALLIKDEPLVMASVAMLVIMLVIGNLIADFLLALNDPRIRLQ